MFYLGYRLVDRSNVAVTQPALARAGWRCERCGSDENLRVIDQRGTILTVCDLCRVKLGQPVSTGSKKPPKKVRDAFEKLLADSSLGSPEAVALRRSVDPALVDRVLERASELEAKAEPVSAVIKVR